MSEKLNNNPYARREISDSDPWQQMAREAAEKAAAEQKKREEAEEAAKDYGHSEYVTKDDIAYQRKLMEMSERPDSVDALGVENGFSEAKKFDPLTNDEIVKNENKVKDYHGGEHDKPGIMSHAVFDENGWLIDNNEYVKTREGKDVSRTYKDWYERFTDTMNDPDFAQNEGEDPKDYQHRIAKESIRRIIKEHEGEEGWKFTEGELNALRTEFPRHKDEKGDYTETYEEWIKRITAEINGGDSPEEPENPDEPENPEEPENPDEPKEDKPDEENAGKDKPEGDASEKGESEEEPVDIDKLAQDLIKARKDMREGATWDKEQRAYIGEDGLPRDWAHLVGYLKNNPDAIKTAKDVLAKLQAENDSGKDEKSEKDEKVENAEKDPLIAMMVNRERDAKIAARMVAEEALHEKLESKKGGAIGRAVRNLIFGQILRDRTLLQYEREAMEAIQEGEDSVRGVNIGKYWTKEGDGAGGKVVERLTMAYTEGMEDALLHSEAGNTMVAYGIETDKDGKKVVYRYEKGKEAAALDAESNEAKVTLKVHELIEQFAKGDLTEHDFDEQVKALKYDLHDKQGLSYEAVGSLVSDTLLETAKAAKERFDHEGGIENVMKGFRLIDADYQSQIRTEAHRSKIDELSEKISDKLGIVQPEVVATAAGIIMYATQAGTSSLARIVAPVIGSSLVAGVFQGFKEHNRVAVDRAEQARRTARGESIGNTKYDDQMSEVQYSVREASVATGQLEELIATGDTAELLKNYADLKARIDFGDKFKMDFIRFTGDGSTETIEDQRLKLDLMLARAEVELRNRGAEDDTDAYVAAVQDAGDRLVDEINQKDAAFRKLQRKRVAAQVAKTVAVGTAIGVVGQETVATFNPNSYGIFDKLNDTMDIRFAPLNIGVNNPDATKTMLASVLGIKTMEEQIIQNTTNFIAENNVKLTDQQRADYESRGYRIIDRQHTVYKPSTHVEQVSGAEYVDANGVKTSIEYLHNNTPGIYDGNELRGYQGVNGDNSIWYARMSGESFNGSTVVNASDPAVQRDIYLAVYLDNTSRAILIPNTPGVVNGGNALQFISDNPGVRDALANNTFYSVSICQRTGETLPDGSELIRSFASLRGSGTAGDAMYETTVTEMVPEVETFSTVIGQRITETVSRIANNLGRPGIAVPLVRRQNLTLPGENAPAGGEPTPTAPTTPESAAEQEEKNRLLNAPEFSTKEMMDYMDEQGIEDETTLNVQELNNLLNGFRNRGGEPASEPTPEPASEPTPEPAPVNPTESENNEDEEKNRLLNEPEFSTKEMMDYMEAQGIDDENALTVQELTNLLNGFRNRGGEPVAEPAAEPAPAPAPENNESGENTGDVVPITDVNDTRPLEYSDEAIRKFAPEVVQSSVTMDWVKDALKTWNEMTPEQRYEVMTQRPTYKNMNGWSKRNEALLRLKTHHFIQTPELPQFA